MQDPRVSGEPQAHGCVVRMQAAMSAVSGGWTAGEGGGWPKYEVQGHLCPWRSHRSVRHIFPQNLHPQLFPKKSPPTEQVPVRDPLARVKGDMSSPFARVPVDCSPFQTRR